ncbi:hypothetical protein PT974_08404 [Cladobotryum mycophilum]|uniref:Uncharacterized protein n=1 Tax=Cladobotryum mycophilum TaxID=491253 RepID=A0ABR0SD93_9HYPO
MPPPPTDAEMIAAFSPREIEFHEQWPDKETQEVYFKFLEKWCGRLSARITYCVPPDEFIEKLCNTKFSDPSIGRLTEDMPDGCQFIVAKIANDVQELKDPKRTFQFDIEHTDECQIVRAKLIGNAHSVVVPSYS